MSKNESPVTPQPKPVTVIPVSRANESEWLERHLQLKKRAQSGGIDLLILGDSITQAMNDVQDLLQLHFKTEAVAAFGSSGDRTQHLLWRIENGELDGLTPKVVAILIGTNNILQHDYSDEDRHTAAGIKACVQAVQKRLPYSRLLVIGILPRGPYADNRTRPHVRYVNSMARQLADNQRVFFVDVEQDMYERNSYGSISPKIMPDFLHLSRAGYDRLFKALAPTVAGLMDLGLRSPTWREWFQQILKRFAGSPADS